MIKKYILLFILISLLYIILFSIQKKVSNINKEEVKGPLKKKILCILNTFLEYLCFPPISANVMVGSYYMFHIITKFKYINSIDLLMIKEIRECFESLFGVYNHKQILEIFVVLLIMCLFVGMTFIPFIMDIFFIILNILMDFCCFIEDVPSLIKNKLFRKSQNEKLTQKENQE